MNSNPKISISTAGWADFRGFTFLFDHPTHAYNADRGLIHLKTNSRLTFYHQLHQTLTGLDLLSLQEHFTFQPLPFYSYHVTFCDGLNPENLSNLNDPLQEEMANFLQGLPQSLCQNQRMSSLSRMAARLQPANGEIDFKFQRLENWSNVSLVAKLSPADKHDQKEYQAMLAIRQRLRTLLRTEFKLNPSHPYQPHITLGYFRYPDSARAIKHRLERITTRFQARMEDQILSLKKFSLYGFLDMATFFKCSAAPGKKN